MFDQIRILCWRCFGCGPSMRPTRIAQSFQYPHLFDMVLLIWGSIYWLPKWKQCLHLFMIVSEYKINIVKLLIHIANWLIYISNFQIYIVKSVDLHRKMFDLHSKNVWFTSQNFWFTSQNCWFTSQNVWFTTQNFWFTS